MEATAEKIETQEAPPVAVQQEPQERYYCIKIAPMQSKFDIPNPVITVGNKAVKHQRIVLKRQTWVPVTGSHVEILKNTKYPVWQNVEGEDRKIATWRTRFPIEDQVKITKEGYTVLRQIVLKEQRDLTDAEVQQYEK